MLGFLCREVFDVSDRSDLAAPRRRSCAGRFLIFLTLLPLSSFVCPEVNDISNLVDFAASVGLCVWGPGGL